MYQLLLNDGEGDWREINESNPRIQAVTAADVKRVANQYLTKENRTVAIYTRKGAVTQEPKPEQKVQAPE
jgi:predicted Zn-dependent peptidase